MMLFDRDYARGEGVIQSEKLRQELLGINEDVPEVGHRALDTEDIYVNRTAEYENAYLQHMHLAHEILFVEEGEAEYIIENKKYHVKKNDILIIGSMDLHRMNVLKVPYVRYGLAISPTYVMNHNNMHKYFPLLKTHSQEKIQLLSNLESQDMQEYSAMLYKIKNEFRRKENLYMECVEAYLTLLFGSLFRKMQLKNQPKITGTAAIMEQICKYINENYYEAITLQKMSEMFYCHPSIISREFVKIYGRNFNQYLNSTRIAAAVQYLEKTRLSITEIAYQCGYQNINTFLRRFHQIMQCSPLQYRKNYNQRVSK